LYVIQTEAISEKYKCNISAIANAIRRSIIAGRSATAIEEWMSVASHLMLAAANKDESMFFFARDGTASVNSQTSIDWTTADFGCPEPVRFHIAGFNNRYLRFFRGNPIRDSVQVAGKGEVEVSLGVDEEIADALVSAIQETLGADLTYYFHP